MARKVKKQEEEGNRSLEKDYSVGIYARLSVDAGYNGQGRKNESIETQINIIKTYVKTQENMEIFDCYTDIGKTGTNFKRKGFERMIEDVRQQRINCIIVKDLSRFGRNHREVGNYIEKIFPFMGVRFIALADHFDSIHPFQKEDTWGITLKNLMNEMYAKDISVKVKSAKKERQKQGSYTGGLAPYGYRIGCRDGRKYLVPKEGSKDIVKKIFDLFLSGKNKKEIIRWLYEHKVATPKEYHRTGCLYAQKQEELQQWSENTIQMILKNSVYTGCLQQEDTHPAIISKEQFQAAADRLNSFRLKYTVYSPVRQTAFAEGSQKDVFSGLLFCGSCGSKMKRSYQYRKMDGRKVRTYRYRCPRSGRIDCLSCKTKDISLDTLTDMVKKALSQDVVLSEAEGKKLLAIRGRIHNPLALQRRQEQIIRMKSEQYLKYCRGQSSMEEFQRKKKELENRKKLLSVKQKEQIEIEKQMDAERARQNQWLKDFISGRENQELHREILEIFIDKIQIYPDSRIQIVYFFQGKR